MGSGYRVWKIKARKTDSTLAGSPGSVYFGKDVTVVVCTNKLLLLALNINSTLIFHFLLWLTVGPKTWDQPVHPSLPSSDSHLPSLPWSSRTSLPLPISPLSSHPFSRLRYLASCRRSWICSCRKGMGSVCQFWYLRSLSREGLRRRESILKDGLRRLGWWVVRWSRWSWRVS